MKLFFEFTGHEEITLSAVIWQPEQEIKGVCRSPTA